MKSTLALLFEKSIELGEETFTKDQIENKWIGNPPARIEEIEKAENRLGIKLPQDYLEMLQIANGFPSCERSTEPSFLKVEEIDFYRNYKWNVIETWKEFGELDEVLESLKKAILIAGYEEEQQFLLIPPQNEIDHWKYWKFAMWIPGEEEYNGLLSYFESVSDFLATQ